MTFTANEYVIMPRQDYTTCQSMQMFVPEQQIWHAKVDALCVYLLPKQHLQGMRPDLASVTTLTPLLVAARNHIQLVQQSGVVGLGQEPGAAPPPSGQAVPPSSGQAAPLSHATVGANAMQTLHSGATVGANAMHVTSEPQQLQHLQLVAHETPQTRGGAGIRRAASSACLVTQAIQMGMEEESRGGRRDWEGVLARSDTHARSVVKLCETISKTFRANLTKTHITTTKSLFTNCNNILSELRSDEGDASIGPKISLAETHSKFLEQYQDKLELHFKFKNRKINSMKAYESYQALVVEVRKHRGALSKWEVQELQEMPWMREDRTKWEQAYVVSIGDIARLLFLVRKSTLLATLRQNPAQIQMIHLPCCSIAWLNLLFGKFPCRRGMKMGWSQF